MDASLLLRTVIEPTLEWLLPEMDSPEARRMLIAIAGQESGFTSRKQIAAYKDGEPIWGPARGWWGFEVPIIGGLKSHHATKAAYARVMEALEYDPETPIGQVQMILTDNDLLACALARLNLRWYPHALVADEGGAWDQYLAIWRPGKPHPHRWPGNWSMASEVV